MTNYNHRGSLWSAQIINKALKLYVACGQKSYEKVQRQNLPYPSIRTLQYRIQSLKFGSGISEDILQLLKMKIETFKSEEKHAILLTDEMSIKPGLQYDRSTNTIIGRPTIKLSGGMDFSNQLATHITIFMLCGITTKWKQTIGYEYTANSFCPQEMTRKILTIIEKAHNIGLIIKVVIWEFGYGSAK
ncbi:uncharacterized protein LOC105203368 isoform X2 [Solenopsis invicta]|uniref:uncharacterized protein LOC105203368 isoform X2 n=1 Tax=Solenopsis invicta TaxID=13686 RepID=UPI000E33FD5E|nr:uncharacterized protein LOC105203368 isoform X2 [Solenopsis invicta]